MAKLLGHEVINQEEFQQFLEGEYFAFKKAAENTAQANAAMLLHMVSSLEKHKKELKLLKVALCVVIGLAVGLLAVMH